MYGGSCDCTLECTVSDKGPWAQNNLVEDDPFWKEEFPPVTDEDDDRPSTNMPQITKSI